MGLEFKDNVLDYYSTYDHEMFSQIGKRLGREMYGNSDRHEYYRFVFLRELYRYEREGDDGPHITDINEYIWNMHHNYMKYFPKSKNYKDYLVKLGLSV